MGAANAGCSKKMKMKSPDKEAPVLGRSSLPVPDEYAQLWLLASGVQSYPRAYKGDTSGKVQQ